MFDQGIVTIIASISGVILVSFLVALIKVITTFVNRNMIDSFNITKSFASKDDLDKFKSEIKRDLAVERVALQELLLQQLDKSIDGKIKELRNIGNKLISVDEMINELKLVREDFKDKIASYNVLEDSVSSLRKELNKMKYGTEKPGQEVVNRRKG